MYMGMCSDEGDMLLVTEYIELGSLKQLLKSKKLDWMAKLRNHSSFSKTISRHGS